MNATKNALTRAMEAYLNGDVKRINHTHRVTEYAEELLKREGGGLFNSNWGIPTSRYRDSPSAKEVWQHKWQISGERGTPIARRILAKLRFEPNQIEEICEIIAHHHSPGKINTRNFKILYDADWLVNLKR